jgi:hypothetical protein
MPPLCNRAAGSETRDKCLNAMVICREPTPTVLAPSVYNIRCLPTSLPVLREDLGYVLPSDSHFVWLNCCRLKFEFVNQLSSKSDNTVFALIRNKATAPTLYEIQESRKNVVILEADITDSVAVEVRPFGQHILWKKVPNCQFIFRK